MNCLLDTSTLIWALSETNRLSPAAKDILDDPSVVKHVSVASLFEMSIKLSIGKLILLDYALEDLPGLLYERGVDLIVLEPFETIALRRLPVKEDHHDPFDRMLICQAIKRNLTLLSGDAKIAQYREHGLSLIW